MNACASYAYKWPWKPEGVWDPLEPDLQQVVSLAIHLHQGLLLPEPPLGPQRSVLLRSLRVAALWVISPLQKGFPEQSGF